MGQTMTGAMVATMSAKGMGEEMMKRMEGKHWNARHGRYGKRHGWY